VSVELATQAAGGHSSLPPRQGAIAILAAAVARLEAEPMPARIDGATRQLLARISPELPFLPRAALANLWIAEPLVIRALDRVPTTSAMLRTTAAVTIFEAGTKENVLPSRARAVVNFRVAPGDGIADVLEHVARVIDDPRVEVKVVGAFSAEPSRLSSADTDAFGTLERAVRAVVPDAVVAPHLVVVVTDARYYERLSESVLRFLPIRMTPDDLQRVHGTNERVAIRDYERAILFYRELIRNAAR
jgi:carboxypeptidase PM20D1